MCNGRVVSGLGRKASNVPKSLSKDPAVVQITQACGFDEACCQDPTLVAEQQGWSAGVLGCCRPEELEDWRAGGLKGWLEGWRAGRLEGWRIGGLERWRGSPYSPLLLLHPPPSPASLLQLPTPSSCHPPAQTCNWTSTQTCKLTSTQTCKLTSTQTCNSTSTQTCNLTTQNCKPATEPPHRPATEPPPRLQTCNQTSTQTCKWTSGDGSKGLGRRVGCTRPDVGRNSDGRSGPVAARLSRRSRCCSLESSQPPPSLPLAFPPPPPPLLQARKAAEGRLAGDAAGSVRAAEGRLAGSAAGSVRASEGRLAGDAAGSVRAAEGRLAGNAAGSVRAAEGRLAGSDAGSVRAAGRGGLPDGEPHFCIAGTSAAWHRNQSGASAAPAVAAVAAVAAAAAGAHPPTVCARASASQCCHDVVRRAPGGA
eukprot:355404-Chlamydomonas_euryale.AAC.6